MKSDIPQIKTEILRFLLNCFFLIHILQLITTRTLEYLIGLFLLFLSLWQLFGNPTVALFLVLRYSAQNNANQIFHAEIGSFFLRAGGFIYSVCVCVPEHAPHFSPSLNIPPHLTYFAYLKRYESIFSKNLSRRLFHLWTDLSSLHSKPDPWGCTKKLSLL